MDSVFDLLRKYEKKGDFAHATVTQQMIKEAEERLSVKLPEAYKKFLMEFGFGGLDGIETLGVAKNGRMVFVDTTLELRASGMPKTLLPLKTVTNGFTALKTSLSR